ncbi:DUF2125 domain-containing protein [Anderseniella sp. Alg231-50]|uniref:DUF2125 domain-containing protein n=1 Tax=Anderseniella sp. Alg231-50 TaxID=1922226 RepID=UPI000D556256
MSNPLEVKRTSPLKTMAPLIVFLCIALAWSVYWYIALGKAKQKLAALEAAHVTLKCDQRSWGGYPFRVHFDCTGVSADLSGTDLTADKLRLIGQAWNPSHIIGALFGPVNINGLKISGDPVRFSYRSKNGSLALASLLAEKQSIALSADKQLTIAKTEAHLRPAADTPRLDLSITLSNLSTGEAQLDSFTVTGALDQTIPREGSFELLSEPSNYFDAVWIARYLGDLDDAEMNAAQAVINPLLKANDNKLPIQLKDQTWYWGPFAVATSK